MKNPISIATRLERQKLIVSTAIGLLFIFAFAFLLNHVELTRLKSDIFLRWYPTPKLITAMASLLALGLFDCVLGSRILGVGALKGGMPIYKYISNRFLTATQNIIVNYKLSEYHTGYRGFTREVLTSLPLEANSDNFVFDNQMLSQIIYGRFRIGEISCPTLYMDDSSSINFGNSVEYGLGVLQTAITFRLHRWGLIHSPIFATIHDRSKD